MNSLSEAEVRKVSEQFSGVFKVRNKGLFMLGVSTGADIRELLTLTIGDVYQNDKLVDKLFFNNRDDVSRTVPVNQDGIKTIQSLIDWHVEHYGNIDAQRPLFPSRNGKGKVALSSKRGNKVLKAASIDAGLNDNGNNLLPSRSHASAKDLIIKLIKLSIQLVRLAHEWLPTLLEFISELEIISRIFS